MTTQQQVAAKIVATIVFVAGLLIAHLILYYSVVNLRGDPGDDGTDLLAWLLDRQSRVADLLSVILAAVPSLAMPTCLKEKGLLTGFGKFVVVILAITFVVAFASKMTLIPNDDSPESKVVAVSVAHGAQLLANFSLTYLGLLFGFKLKGDT